jgi:hypothetical protein
MLRVASARTVVELARSSYLTVRPELRRRAPMGFSHSLTNVRDLGFLPEPALSIAEGVEMTREKETGVRSLRHSLCEWARINLIFDRC